MRYLISLLIVLAAFGATACVFNSGDTGTKDPAETGTVVDGGNQTALSEGGLPLDEEGRPMLNQLPEGIDPEDVVKIEVPRADFDGDGNNDEYEAPPGAEDITGPVAKNFDAEFVEVRPLDDPENPYLGQYTEYDRWHYDNFDPGAPFMLSGKPGERSGSLVVTDDGWAEPYLVTMRKSLEFEAGEDPDTSHITKGFKLYSRAVISPELDAEIAGQRARLTAEFAPPIPRWLAQSPPRWALVLPDGHVATYGVLGSGPDFFPSEPTWLRDEPLPACHYDGTGRLVERLDPGNVWVKLFFPDFEAALATHQVTIANVQTYGKYVVFHNPDDESLSGLYLYDGTLITEEESQDIRDVTRHFEMFGKYIPVMYGAQQGWPEEATE